MKYSQDNLYIIQFLTDGSMRCQRCGDLQIEHLEINHIDPIGIGSYRGRKEIGESSLQVRKAIMSALQTGEHLDDMRKKYNILCTICNNLYSQDFDYHKLIESGFVEKMRNILEHRFHSIYKLKVPVQSRKYDKDKKNLIFFLTDSKMKCEFCGIPYHQAYLGIKQVSPTWKNWNDRPDDAHGDKLIDKIFTEIKIMNIYHKYIVLCKDCNDDYLLMYRYEKNKKSKQDMNKNK
jgi:hypothetical protein